MLRGTKKMVRRCSPRAGFTIVELLTVMSIIIILISVLVPALSKVRRYAKDVTQRGQFHEISKGLELYRNEHSDTLPDSGAASIDSAGNTVGYCGAMKLCEALLGQDGMGFHPLSKFTADGKIMFGTDACDLYPFDLCTLTDPADYTGVGATRPQLAINLQQRIKYIDSEKIKAVRLKDLYSWYNNGSNGLSYPDYDPVVGFGTSTDDYPYDFPNAVITDVYSRATSRCNAGKVGMPVLYYKADPSKLVHDSNTIYLPTNPNIYNFNDNYAIMNLGLPWETSPPPAGPTHPMDTSPLLFYTEITNTKVTATPRPHNEDTYILMSAGFDGLYGTRDDVFNFVD